MIKFDDRVILHEYIILDMAIKSLQHDYPSLETLKMSTVYIGIVEGLLKRIRNDYYNKKRLLKKKSIEIVKWTNIDEHFTEVTVTTQGEDESFSYAKQALKTQTEQLIQKYLNNR